MKIILVGTLLALLGCSGSDFEPSAARSPNGGTPNLAGSGGGRNSDGGAASGGMQVTPPDDTSMDDDTLPDDAPVDDVPVDDDVPMDDDVPTDDDVPVQPPDAGPGPYPLVAPKLLSFTPGSGPAILEEKDPQYCSENYLSDGLVQGTMNIEFVEAWKDLGPLSFCLKFGAESICSDGSNSLGAENCPVVKQGPVNPRLECSFSFEVDNKVESFMSSNVFFQVMDINSNPVYIIEFSPFSRECHNMLQYKGGKDGAFTYYFLFYW